MVSHYGSVDEEVPGGYASRAMDILLVHGALGAAAQMTPLQSALGGSAYMVELEGHGDTPMPAERYDVRRFAQNVRDYMRDRGIERAGVFGYSMGGYVALLLAAESPELVTSVATLATKLAWSPEVAVKETSRLDPTTIRAKVPKFAAALEQRHAGAGGWEAVLSRTSTLMTELGARPVLDAGVLARITQPARLMVGDRDTVVSVDETAAAARTLAAGEFGVLPNTAHPLEQVRMPLLAAALHDFFRP
jgi:pimeloyl-ACP methyl ester carboxylesterase